MQVLENATLWLKSTTTVVERMVVSEVDGRLISFLDKFEVSIAEILLPSLSLMVGT